jgi:hypothetical protein
MSCNGSLEVIKLVSEKTMRHQKLQTINPSAPFLAYFKREQRN